MSKPKVLIVEDNPINALVIRKAIEAMSDPVHVINDRETFKQLKEETFAIIFMDINLGSKSMDGEEIMKQLKDDPKYSHIPIIAVTSYAKPGDRERFLNAGFDAYIPKPVSRELIIDYLQRGLPG